MLMQGSPRYAVCQCCASNENGLYTGKVWSGNQSVMPQTCVLVRQAYEFHHPRAVLPRRDSGYTAAALQERASSHYRASVAHAPGSASGNSAAPMLSDVLSKPVHYVCAAAVRHCACMKNSVGRLPRLQASS